MIFEVTECPALGRLLPPNATICIEAAFDRTFGPARLSAFAGHPRPAPPRADRSLRPSHCLGPRTGPPRGRSVASPPWGIASCGPFAARAARSFGSPSLCRPFLRRTHVPARRRPAPGRPLVRPRPGRSTLGFASLPTPLRLVSVPIDGSACGLLRSFDRRAERATRDRRRGSSSSIRLLAPPGPRPPATDLGPGSPLRPAVSTPPPPPRSPFVDPTIDQLDEPRQRADPVAATRPGRDHRWKASGERCVRRATARSAAPFVRRSRAALRVSRATGARRIPDRRRPSRSAPTRGDPPAPGRARGEGPGGSHGTPPRGHTDPGSPLPPPTRPRADGPGSWVPRALLTSVAPEASPGARARARSSNRVSRRAVPRPRRPADADRADRLRCGRLTPMPACAHPAQRAMAASSG